jgi:hypothetical protein
MSAISYYNKYKKDAVVLHDIISIIDDNAVLHPKTMLKENPSEKINGLVINPAFYSSNHHINLTGNVINEGISASNVKKAVFIPGTIYSEMLHDDKSHVQKLLLGGGLYVDTHKLNK